MNKKFFLYCLFFLTMLVVFSSCNTNLAVVSENTTEITTEEATILTTVFQSEKVDFTQHENDVSGGAIIEQRKYRVRYYSIPAPFADLVGREACYEWEIEYNKTHDVHSSERMLIVDFVNAFNISRENFEKANLALAKNFEEHHKTMMNPLDHTNQEIYEIFNPDIIYTFDDEIINKYYLSHDYPFLYEHEYEEALANGTYETRTTNWIDIEAMEAEIIAKYGEAEIVTETTTAEQTEAE